MLDALAKLGSNIPAMMPKRLALLPPTQPIKELIGPGLFRFVPADSMADQKLVFARNDDYEPRKEPPVWASGGKVVKIDRLEMIAIPDPAVQLDALLAREVDYIERVQADLMPLLKSGAGQRLRTIHQVAVQIVVRLNHLQPPFDNVQARVRRQICCSNWRGGSGWTSPAFQSPRWSTNTWTPSPARTAPT